MSFLAVVSQKLKALATRTRTVGSSRPTPMRLQTSIEAATVRVQSNGVEAILSAVRQKTPVTLIHGRAGTGKTTLVRKLISDTQFQHVVVAPTGVAALNAGGQTIHSFFRLPPKMINLDEILPNHRLKSIVRRLDFIVIDEISMVRADLLDAIDRTLKVNRGNDAPFGGVPMLLVGDFLQLPPVVEKSDAEILRKRGYSSHFAFAADCLQSIVPNVVELTTVHRQKGVEFIRLLGQLRIGEDVEDVINALNRSCHRPHRSTATPVILTARTNAADRYNMSGLAALPGNMTSYIGKIVGDFQLKDKRLPAPEFLDLKPGARVMLVKNDPNKRWVNGSLGTVTRLKTDSVCVRLDESSLEYPVTKESWESVRYEWDHATQRIQSKVIGTYSQIPMMLAWATTIHKAQGLTLSDVRVDLGEGAFSDGQTYVALSRATSIDGLSLAKPLTRGDVRANSDLVDGVSALATRGSR